MAVLSDFFTAYDNYCDTYETDLGSNYAIAETKRRTIERLQCTYQRFNLLGRDGLYTESLAEYTTMLDLLDVSESSTARDVTVADLTTFFSTGGVSLGSGSGITVDGTDIDLGGVLDADTAVSTTNQSIRFILAGDDGVDYSSKITFSIEQIILTTYDSTGFGTLSGYAGLDIYRDDYIELKFFSSALAKKVMKFDSSGMLITDTEDSKGFVYASDYSTAGKADDRWIPDYGAVKNAIRTVSVTTVNTATYDLLATDYILNVTYTATGAVTSLTLPTAQCISGRTIIVKDAGGNAGTNNITIDTEGSETIDGAATAVINSDYSSVNIYCENGNWFIY